MGNGVNGSINNVTWYAASNYEQSWLLVGTKWGGAVGTGVTLKFSFVTNPSAITYDTGVLGGFSSAQQAAAKQAQAAWAAVADIKFTQVTDSTSGAGDIRWLNSSTPPTAWAYYPTQNAEGGDVWVGTSHPDYKSPVVGNYGYATFMHELGHALGLQHPHEVSGTPVLRDQLKYSIMSYRDFAGDSLDGYTSAFYPTTPMLDDIKAIQTLYGKNMSFNAGNTVYKWGATQSIYQTIWDAAGVDTIDASNQLKGVVLNLNPGTFSQIGKTFFNGKTSVNDCLAIAYDCTIENAIGSALSDTLYGNTAGNVLSGGAGNDRLFGYAGNDVLNGGAGIDTLIGSVGNDTYYLDNVKDIVSETSTLVTEIDTVIAGFSYTLGANLERLTLTGSAAINGYGNALANTIVGNAGANTLSGGAGADILNGLGGIDRLIGGTGADTYVVDNVRDVVSETTTSSAEIDRVISSISYTLGANLENLTLSGSSAINGTGNALSNILIGNAAANVLNGGAGADILNGGAGSDMLIGGTGADTYYVDNAGDRISETSTLVSEIDLVVSSVSYSLGANLENLILSGSGNINGTGNALANMLTGNAGANTLNGGGGADVLNGGAGADVLWGGEGADRFIFDSLIGSDSVQDFESGVDRIVLDNSALGGVGNNDAVLDGAIVTATAGFDNAAELIIFSNLITGTITNNSASDIIGNSGGSFSVGDERVFVVNNGTQSGVYLFEEKYGDTAVAADELQLLGILNVGSTQIGDYVLQA